MEIYWEEQFWEPSFKWVSSKWTVSRFPYTSPSLPCLPDNRVRERQNDRIKKAGELNASKQAEKIGYVPRNKQTALKESGLASAGKILEDYFQKYNVQ